MCCGWYSGGALCVWVDPDSSYEIINIICYLSFVTTKSHTHTHIYIYTYIYIYIYTYIFFLIFPVRGPLWPRRWVEV